MLRQLEEIRLGLWRTHVNEHLRAGNPIPRVETFFTTAVPTVDRVKLTPSSDDSYAGIAYLACDGDAGQQQREFDFDTGKWGKPINRYSFDVVLEGDEPRIVVDFSDWFAFAELEMELSIEEHWVAKHESIIEEISAISDRAATVLSGLSAEQQQNPLAVWEALERADLLWSGWLPP